MAIATGHSRIKARQGRSATQQRGMVQSNATAFLVRTDPPLSLLLQSQRNGFALRLFQDYTVVSDGLDLVAFNCVSGFHVLARDHGRRSLRIVEDTLDFQRVA